MKKTLTALLISVLMLVLLPAAAMADGAEAGIAIDVAHFPDDNFRSYVAEKCDTDQDGYLSEAEISAVEIIDVSNQEIRDLTGIELFFALTELNCNCYSENGYSRKGQLTSLTVGANTALRKLECVGNALTSLDVSGCTALGYLDCSVNDLTSLDVSNCAALQALFCSGNVLADLDLSDNVALIDLRCEDNQLKSLDLSANKELGYLSCEHNQLTSLNVNADIVDGSISDQAAIVDLTETNRAYLLDFTALVGPENVERITVESVTPADAEYSIMDGLLTTETMLTTLTYTYSYGESEIDKMDVTLVNRACIQVPDKAVAIDESNFPDDSFRSYVSDMYDRNHDGFLNIEEAIAVTSIDFNDNCIFSDLTGIEYFVALTKLDCDSMALRSLDVSNNPFLLELHCGCNWLTNLNVSANPALEKLDCAANYLTYLDVSSCLSLRGLYCGVNHLTSLDISANTALTELWCSGNQLTSLDVSANTALIELDCGSNALTSLDVSANTALTVLDCERNQLTILDLTANKMLLTYYEYKDSNVSSQEATAALTETKGTYRLDFANLVRAENVDRVTVTSVTPADAQYSVQDGVLTTETALTSLTYEYAHGGPDVGTMDVTLEFN